MTLDLFGVPPMSAAVNPPPSPAIPPVPASPPNPLDMTTELAESGGESVSLTSDESLISALLVLSAPLRPPIMASCTVLGWCLTIYAVLRAIGQEDESRETTDSELFCASMEESRVWPLAARLKLLDRQVSSALESNKSNSVKFSSWASRIVWLSFAGVGIGFVAYENLAQIKPVTPLETPAQTTPDLDGLNQPAPPVNPPSQTSPEPSRPPAFSAPDTAPNPAPPARQYSVPLKGL
jgi:hypothetical protein